MKALILLVPVKNTYVNNTGMVGQQLFYGLQFPLGKWLFTDTVSVNKTHLTDTVSVNKKHLTDTVSVNKMHLTDTVSVNKKHLKDT